ncbi:RNA-dependent ATPase rok1 [Emydomyces testavorans]|uniref:ATP-dependent RNA helicase ROK1 n=1 Tax=Emydomyces testavorans TaxID=2070801 RepID=A0AAF0IFM5_9EURO|nr:RNA-dependent ATPase rok1 [Emydomyces testavorans]
MDAFKLLTRSTKLKGSSKHGDPSISHHLPSAGDADTPQLFPARKAVISATDGTRGTKRKRDSEKGFSLSSDVAVPDFFGSEPTPASSVNLSKDRPTKKPGTEKDIDSEDEDTAEEIKMPEEECKSILKSHKIKITDLRTIPVVTAVEDNSGKKSKRKKTKVKESTPLLTRKQQKAAQRLYPEPLTSFGQLRTKYKISRRLSENIANQGYTVPTEVQLGALPLLLGGAPGPNSQSKGDGSFLSQSEQELDLLVVAPTGSGKTLAFMIPLICKIMKHHRDTPGFKGILAIVVAPTKELVAQIVNEGRKLTAGTGVKVTAMRKGMRIVEESGEDEGSLEKERDDDNSDMSSDDEIRSHEENKLKVPLTKCDILVCTPLILANALLNEKKKDMAQLRSVQTLVLDEADVLLDPLFREQTLHVWRACTSPQLRVGLWSATMGSNIEELTKSTIKERQKSLGLKDESFLTRLVVGLKDTAIPNITHKLVYAATEQGKLLGLRQLLHPTAASSSTTRLRPPFLVFTQTIARAVALHSELMYDIPPEAGGSARIAVLHSELSDSKRSDVMAGFRKGEIWILITTDLLSRGVDFRGINGVVNYDIPNSSAAYVHRVGRTGRAGREGGVAVTFYTKEDIPYVKNIANVISASEKLRGTEEGGCIPKWLLDSLPSLSKKDKKDLKKYGVKTRRPSAITDGKAGKKTRISTKSGFDRKMENKRKGAIKGSQQRKARGQSDEMEGEHDAWNGIED